MAHGREPWRIDAIANPPSMRKRLKLTLAALAVAGIALGADALWIEPSSLRVAEHEIAVAGWSCPPIRIAVLADIHAGSPYIGRDKLQRIVELTNAQQPDLILLAGDYVIDDVFGGSFIPPEELAQTMAQLQAPLGRYAVLGNHDRLLGAARMQQAFAAAGLPLLDNDTRRLQHAGCGFWLAGLEDIGSGRPRPDMLAQRFAPGEPVIAVTHSPDVFAKLAPRYALLIAGHTHGGQVRLPWFGALLVPSSYGQRYAIGHVHEHTDLFVSSGIGTSIFPIRFGAPPEISLLTVHAP